VRGNAVCAVAMTEPNAGSDLRGLTTRAVRDGDDWLLSGSKLFISGGGDADVVVVVARSAPAGATGSSVLSLFVVDAKEAVGQGTLQRGPRMDKLGMRATDTRPLYLDNVRVPTDALLGTEGRGLHMLMANLPMERLVIGATSVAGAAASWERARAHCKERRVYGHPLAELQTVRHTLARLRARIAAAQSFVDEALLLAHDGRLDAQTASAAKLMATELLQDTTDAEVQLAGGMGYDMSHPAARAFAEARVQRIYGGANEVMLELLARAI
jgi:alkylation response protein AidB-like acyl-CoA dehydrogenase